MINLNIRRRKTMRRKTMRRKREMVPRFIREVTRQISVKK
jgi:hypothetical protein